MIVTIIKLLIVVLFLIRFLRRPSLPWGIGLLTVSTAVLLDTVLGTFNREDALEQFGFFFYVLAGSLFAGAALWLWGVARPYLPGATRAAADPGPTASASTPASMNVAPAAVSEAHTPMPPMPVVEKAPINRAGYDRPALHADMVSRLGREDVLDLIYDIGLNEMEITGSEPDLSPTVNRLLDAAEQAGKIDEVTLGIERILNPPTAGTLPRLEKLNAESPRPVLRYYLLSHYTVEQLRQLAAGAGVDWDELPGRAKRGRVRELLDTLYRRDTIDQLLSRMKAGA